MAFRAGPAAAARRLGAERGWPGGRETEIAAALAVGVGGRLVRRRGGDITGRLSDALAPDVRQAVTFATRFGHDGSGGLSCSPQCSRSRWWPARRGARDGALVALAAAVAHLLCAMGWIGGLFWLMQVLRRAMVGDLDAHVLPVVVQRFSRVGYWLVALLLISGCVNALVLLPWPDSLVTSTYGRVLLVKLGLVLIMLGFALYNRVVLVGAGHPGENRRARAVAKRHRGAGRGPPRPRQRRGARHDSSSSVRGPLLCISDIRRCPLFRPYQGIADINHP